MKLMFIVIFTFLISPLAGANVTKTRVSNDTFHITLTGQDALRLRASMKGNSFSSSSPLETLSCLDSTDHFDQCEISLKRAHLEIYSSIQEQLRLADESGLPLPQMNWPRDASEQLLTVKIDDSTVAEKLYNLLPGPEVDDRLDRSIADAFSGKTKSVDLARNQFFMSCQQITRLAGHNSSAIKKGYSCVVNAIVPSGKMI